MIKQQKKYGNKYSDLRIFAQDGKPGSISYYIKAASNAISKPYSYLFKNAIYNFKVFVASKFKIARDTNDEQHFFNELFSAISLQSLNQDSLLYIIFLSELTSVDIGDKIIKANKIKEDLLSIKPVTHPLFWFHFQRILLWLQRTSGSSFQLMIYPLLDNIMEWSDEDDDSEKYISSLKLLAIFFGFLPDWIVDSDKSTFIDIIYQGFLNKNTNVRYAAQQTLKSVLNSSVDLNAEELCSCFMSTYYDKDVDNYQGISEALTIIIDLKPEYIKYLKFKSIPFKEMSSIESNFKIAAFCSMPIALKTTPELFTEENTSIIYLSYKPLISRMTSNRTEALVSFGELVYLKKGKFTELELSALDQIYPILMETCDCEQSAYALISLVTSNPSRFDDVSKAVFALPLSDYIISAFAKLIEIRPEFSEIIYNHIMQTISPLLLSKETQPSQITTSFKALINLKVPLSYVSEQLCLHFSLHMSHKDKDARKAACNYVLWYQQNSCSACVLQRILAIVMTETDQDLRINLISKIKKKPCDDIVVSILQTLIRDSTKEVSKYALKFMARYASKEIVYSILNSFLLENISILQNSPVLSKQNLRPFHIISSTATKKDKESAKAAGKLLAPFRLPLMKILLSGKHKNLPHIALELITDLIPLTEIDEKQMNELAYQITTNLSIQLKESRIKTALRMLTVALDSTYIIIHHNDEILNSILLLTMNNSDDDFKESIVHVLSRLGASRQNLIKTKNYHMNIISPNIFIARSESNDPAAILQYTCACVSLMTFLDILSNNSLSHLHQLAINALVTTLKNNRRLGKFIEEKLISRYIEMLKKDLHSVLLLSSIQTLKSSVSQQSFAPLIPYVIDTICQKWNSTKHSDLERITTWLYYSIPEEMKPYLPRLVTTFLSDTSSIDSVLQTLINFGTSISSVVHIVYPIILDWVLNNSDKIKTCEKVLGNFKIIIKNGGSKNYAVLIFNTLTAAVQMNLALKGAALEVIYFVAVQMKNYFLLHIPSLSKTFDFSKHQKLTEFINCLENNLPIPAEILNDVLPKPGVTPFPDTQPPVQKYKPVALEVPETNIEVDDWDKWFKKICRSVFEESSSRAVSAYFEITKRYGTFSNELFPLAFVLIVIQNPDDNAIQIIRNVMTSKTAPGDLKVYFLNVIEIMELLELECPVSDAVLAENCRYVNRYAQAMRSTERMFINGDTKVGTQLTHLYIILDLVSAAHGILKVAKSDGSISEKLGNWESAIEEYKAEIKESPDNEDLRRGLIHCYWNLGRFDEYMEAAKDVNYYYYAAKRSSIDFDIKEMIEIAKKQDPFKNNNNFLSALYHLSNRDFDKVDECLKEMRKPLINKVIPLIYFDYKRSYKDFLKLTLIGEIEELSNAMRTNDFKRFDAIADYKFSIMKCDSDALLSRLIIRIARGQNVDSHDITLSYISESIAEHRFAAAESAISYFDHEGKNQKMNVLRCKLDWEKGNKNEAVHNLMKISNDIESKKLAARWLLEVDEITEAKEFLKETTETISSDAEIWHQLSRADFFLFEKTNNYDFVVDSFTSALNGLSLGSNLSLSIRIIQILFQHCSEQIIDLLESRIATIPDDVWIDVLPQIIGRAAFHEQKLVQLLHKIIYTVGCAHPQPVLYSLMVPLKSDSMQRKKIAIELSGKLAKIFPSAVKSMQILASELMRVAANWFELSFTYLSDVLTSPKEKAFSILSPLFEIISSTPETFMETSYVRQFGSIMDKVKEWITKYNETKSIEAYNQGVMFAANAWNKIKELIPKMVSFKLSDVSPQLYTMESISDLSVPGTYKCGKEIVYIQGFSKVLDVMDSKQRPRKISIFGNDGVEYQFLLKAHEDTRLDERVMQLFDFINSFSGKDKLKITTYSVTPLTDKVGLIGWVPHCQTLFALINKHRGKSSVSATLEYDETLRAAESGTFKDYCQLPLESKVRAFDVGINATKGDDLEKVLLLISSSSGEWVQHRNMYSTSLAVTSMIGYIIGLGDRHLNNIMLNFKDSRLVHIDYGDCFEVRMHDDEFPELVPFRLTRILTNALEAKSIEGTFRSTCEEIMRIIQDKGDQIIALLEVFIHDPLLQWINISGKQSFSQGNTRNTPAVMTVNRIRDKLRRTDIVETRLTVEEQVEALISRAIDHKNLCQMYEGWYPWW